MTIQKTANGNLLKLTAGSIAKECCCGGEGTACSTETCSGTNNPTMLLTIFDSDYAGGDINWCGKTWTNAEVKAGVTKCACPTTYVQGCHVQLPPTAAGSYYTNHTWSFAGATGLRLIRKRDLSTGSSVYATNQFSIGPGTLYSYNAFFGSSIPPASSSSVFTMTTDSGVTRIISAEPYGQCGVNPATTPDYLLLPAWFSSFTILGIEYTWTKGTNWP